MQLTVERRVTTFNEKGQMVRTWKCPKGARNEALDGRVYAWAAYQGLVSERRVNLEVLAMAHRELPFFEPVPIAVAEVASDAAIEERADAVDVPAARVQSVVTRAAPVVPMPAQRRYLA